MSEMHKFALAICVALCAIIAVTDGVEISDKATRQGKLFPVFQIVTFPNDPCIGTGTQNGTCYTSAECTSRGGTNAGSCANGFGICCAFTATCGQSYSENCTYFMPPTTVAAGSCTLKICPCGNDICQLRLDFNQFVITGPSTATASSGLAQFNQLVAAKGRTITNNGQCLTDTFSVTNPTGTNPPVICGTNTAQHMYVDSSTACNDLTFQFGNQGNDATVANRNWNIKITQYSCSFDNLAPSGCTEYFHGSNTGTVQTYNFQNEHLANQNQVFCVRRERGFCRICWSATANIDFMVSNNVGVLGKKIVGGGVNLPSQCCQYGADASQGLGVKGFDCLEIPGAQKAKTLNAFIPSRICGRSFGIVSFKGAMTGSTICSTDMPFTVRFVSDQFENLAESAAPDAGFRLGYFMDNNC